MTGVLTAIGFIVVGFLWFDDRYHPRNAETAIEELRVEILKEMAAAHSELLAAIKAGDYTDQIKSVTLVVADLTSTIGRYNTMEEAEVLTPGDRVRREALRRQKDIFIEEIARLSNLRDQL